jgi:predicted AlkP superfamily pyrophosphatase or phosphodiesterase
VKFSFMNIPGGAMLRTLALGALLAAGQPLAAADPPRLVLQITVDQLRGDMLHRFADGLGGNGFRRLTDSGLYYLNAHHRHANTETVVGHATLATGADPAVHGMVANLWFDRETGEQVYNVQDAKYPLAGGGGVDSTSEIDPTQRAATAEGRSPRNIITTTIADEIAIRFGPDAKIFGVSVKDRGAITMAGHAGQAYWFSKSAGRFVTSTFYREDYPAWVKEWNAKGAVAAYGGTHWALTGPAETYQFGTRDDQIWETDFPGFGRTFPHAYGPADGKYFTTFLTLSPAGDELTVDFATALIDAEQLGQDDVTDYLSVSLSSTDYVGHIFGPSSLEAEDNIRRLDASLARLLEHADAAVGLDNTLVLLSADHGAPEHPGYLAAKGIHAQLFDFKRVDTEPGFVRLIGDFGAGAELIRNFSAPYLYLDREEIAARGLDLDQVADRVAAELERLPGIARAISSARLRRGEVASDIVNDAIRANFHPDRSGDIYIVFEPQWFIADFDGLTVAASHGSPWAYDTHVPLIIAGPGIEPGRVARRVETVDAAVTLAAYLGTRMPSGAAGEPLAEVFEHLGKAGE